MLKQTFYVKKISKKITCDYNANKTIYNCYSQIFNMIKSKRFNI